MTPKAALLAAAAALAFNVHALAQPAAPAPGDLAEIRAALGGDKRAFVAGQLALSDAEAKRFWPIYDRYQRQLATTTRRAARLVEEVVALDRPPTDAHAKKLAEELVAIDEEEAKDRRRAQRQLMRSLPPSKVLRYLQIENKAAAIRAYDIAGAIPLAK